MPDKKKSPIGRDVEQSREYLPWWGEVLLVPIGNSIDAWGRITNYIYNKSPCTHIVLVDIYFVKYLA